MSRFVLSDDAEYTGCVDCAMDALLDRRLAVRAVARLSGFGSRGLPWQQEHIDRLIKRLSK